MPTQDFKMKSEQILTDLENILKNQREQFYKSLEQDEGITQQDLELVDLEIDFSPVIPFHGGKPVEAIETMGGAFYVTGYPNIVSAEMLKVMRYRYLSQRKNPLL